jgi:hypothetical protein
MALAALRRYPLTVATASIGAVILVVALPLATEPARRRARYLERAAWHQARIEGWRGAGLKNFPVDGDGKPLEGRRLALWRWHSGMHFKYANAAREPMRGVPPDPPMP